MTDRTGLCARLERPGLQDQVILGSLMPEPAIAASDPGLFNLLARLVREQPPREDDRPPRDED